MKKIVIGLFGDSKLAGEAVSELKQKGYTDNISLVAKKEDEIATHQVKQDVSDGVNAGAIAGGITGALVGLIAGLGAITLPGGIFLLAGGPLTAAWVAGGTAVGALSGGLLGALIDWGIPEERARFFEDAVMSGEILVAVTVDEDSDHDMKVSEIMEEYQAREIAAYSYNE